MWEEIPVKDGSFLDFTAIPEHVYLFAVYVVRALPYEFLIEPIITKL